MKRLGWFSFSRGISSIEDKLSKSGFTPHIGQLGLSPPPLYTQWEGTTWRGLAFQDTPIHGQVQRAPPLGFRMELKISTPFLLCRLTISELVFYMPPVLGTRDLPCNYTERKPKNTKRGMPGNEIVLPRYKNIYVTCHGLFDTIP